MLQRIRDGLQGQRWLAYIVLGVLALVFAAWGAYGVVSLDFGLSNYAAKAEGHKISLQEAREAWMREQMLRQQQLGGEIPEEQRRQLQDRILESLVRQTLLAERTQDLGYRVTRESLREAIRSVPAFQVNGQYSPDAAKAVMAQQGLTPAAFEAELRRSLRMAQVETGIRMSDFVTPREAERLRALQEEQREARYVVLPAEKFAGKEPVSDEEVRAYYEQHQTRFLNPESVHLRYAELRLDEVATQVQVTEADVREAYEKDREKFTRPERRRSRHILIRVDADTDDAAARKKAEELLARVKAGEDFAQLAKEHSDDTGSAARGGDLDWAERNYFVGPFADALFSMEVGEVRGPVKTDFGYHVIRLDDIQPATTRTFEDVRPELEAQLREDRAADRFGDIIEQIDTRLQVADADLDALAKEFGLKTGEVTHFLRDIGGPPLGAARELQEVVFSPSVLEERRVGGPVILGEDRLILVKVEEHRTPTPKPLEEVREQIVAAIRDQRGTEAAAKAVEDAKAKLEGGASFEEVAKSLGVSVEPARFVGRNDPSVPAQVRRIIFESPKPAGNPVIQAKRLDSGAALVMVTGLRTGGGEEDPQQRAQWARRVAATYGYEDAIAYVEEMRRTADVVKNPRAFD